MSVSIGKLKVLPYIDPSGNGDTLCGLQLWLDPRAYTCEVRDYYLHQRDVPAAEYHNHVLTVAIAPAAVQTGQLPDADALREWLTDGPGQELLTRICDGHAIIWDGHNHVGELDADAEAAFEALSAALDDWPLSDWEVIADVAAYLYEWAESEVTPDMTEADLSRLAAEAERAAAEEQFFLGEDATRYLAQVLAEKQAAALADEAED